MVPTFNADKLFFTPAFVLPVDKVRSRDNLEVLHAELDL